MANYLNTILNLDDNDDESSLKGFDKLISFILAYWVPSMFKEPSSRGSTGHRWVLEILASRGSCCQELFRMDKDVFFLLCRTLAEHHRLREHTTSYVSAEEMVAMFLFSVGHGVGNRVVQAIFRRSSETVGHVCQLVLDACFRLSHENIKASDPQFRECHPKISNHYPHFRDSIGVIDGTQIKCVVDSANRRRFTRKKCKYPTQNVMAVCDWDMCFTFVLAGWHGTVEDNSVLEHAVSKDSHYAFPHPPSGKYYLVDAKYSTSVGYLGPYRPPHQPGFIEANKTFNSYHSRLRLTIERTFGVWKNRFRVLRDMPRYEYKKQVDIVCATMALHNFVRRHSSTDDDDYFQPSDDDSNDDDSDGDGDEQPSASTNNYSQSEILMSHYRDRIRENIIVINNM